MIHHLRPDDGSDAVGLATHLHPELAADPGIFRTL